MIFLCITTTYNSNLLHKTIGNNDTSSLYNKNVFYEKIIILLRISSNNFLVIYRKEMIQKNHLLEVFRSFYPYPT